MEDQILHVRKPDVYHSQRRGALLSIWFFCGILMLAYGLLLIGQGIYERFGHQPATVFADLHATLWWGVLLTVFGGFYAVRFWPARTGRTD